MVCQERKNRKAVDIYKWPKYKREVLGNESLLKNEVSKRQQNQEMSYFLGSAVLVFGVVE